MTKLRYLMGLFAALTLIALVGCLPSEAPAQNEQATIVAKAPATATAANDSTATDKKVAKIVFVGKENACECTAKRIDDTWTTLQTALKGRKHVKVERIQIDTEEAKAKPYQKMGAVMVIPGVYLLDQSGALVEMLQGEVTADQFAKALR